ncbi:nitrogen fixation negative regulator NifL [Ectothiorhodospira mobilis]|uniref:nitrogen fixation negative regulator NifL n=1 Tax=Ectothiorhodospira mobilis TaxID=195064 RepID=UPI001905D3F4|nr:nitrogen fixation negative regulator NifL [Ectothiorhodospira mobilis]MBK1690593.1 nitrogen fixation negative regulator NifL [Ectothiorhodospira mobilis]
MPRSDPPFGAEDDVPLPPRLFYEAVEQSSMAISITDDRARILYANPAFTRVTGYPAGEVIGRNASILSDRHTPALVYETLWGRLRQLQPWTGRLVNRRRDGSRYLAELSIAPVLDASGRLSHYLGMHRDITGMHRLEQQVHNQKALIESVVDAEPVAIALLDANGGVVLDNQEYKKLAGDLRGREPAQMLLEGVHGAEGVGAVMGGGGGFSDREVRIDPGGGRGARWFSCSGTWITEQDAAADAFFAPRRVSYLLLMAKEVTTLRRREEEMRINALRALTAESERVEGMRETLEAAAYRMQEPVNLIQAAVQLLQRRGGEGPDEALMRVLNDALESGRQALQTLENCIPERREGPAAPVNLNAVLREVLGLFTQRLLAAGVVVEWDPAPVLPPVLGHEASLRGLFKQLLDNALDALESGGDRRELHLRTRAREDAVQVEIRDTGPGIPEALRLRVFEPFFSTKGRSGDGAGMGLPMVQEVVNRHAGLVAIDPAPPPGCCVRLQFPVQPAEAG